MRLGSAMPVFLAIPVGVSEAAEDLRAILVVPPVLLEPEGFRVLWNGISVYLCLNFMNQPCLSFLMNFLCKWKWESGQKLDYKVNMKNSLYDTTFVIGISFWHAGGKVWISIKLTFYPKENQSSKFYREVKTITKKII